MSRARSRTWTWSFDSPAPAVWAVLADTARFNEAADLPKHLIEDVPQPDGSVRHLAAARVGLMDLRWEERPVNWVHERWFEHRRDFRTGPFSFLCARFRLHPESGGCRGEYTLEAAPRTWWGRLLLDTVFFDRVGRSFAGLADAAREYAAGRSETRYGRPAPQLPEGAIARAGEAVTRIEASPHGHQLARPLADLVLEGQEVDLWSMRPLALARAWSVPDRHAIEVCLEAVKQGLLRLRWDLLCPRCQVGKASVSGLDELPRGAHCSTCNIDYERDYTNNVELAFHPARRIRPLEGGEYCLFGPMSTPHIKLQLTLAPGERRSEPLDLPPGRYRLRTLEPGGEADVEFTGGAFPSVTVTGTDGVAAGPSDAPGQLVLGNQTDRSRTVVVEELGWMRDALTARRATALQAFRDLFGEDTLRPGDNVEIDHISILFTDLRGSTALYERIGDPKAYRLVREHFSVLGRAVRECDGAVVKTIGDAIMAVFVNPADALRCAVRIQDDFHAFNRTSAQEPIVIKVGIHAGRCISVTLNDRLDYYGTTANKAARLQGQSDGGDIVLSPELAADPAVAGLLVDYPVREESATLKGFAEPIRFLRIPPAALQERRGHREPPGAEAPAEARETSADRGPDRLNR